MSRLDELRNLHARGRLVLKARPAEGGSAPAGPGARQGAGPVPPGAGAPRAGGLAPGSAAAAAGGGDPAEPAVGPFRPVATELGTAWCWRTVYPLTFAHGRGTPGAWYRDLQRSLGILAALAGPARMRQPVPAAVEQLLFLDLETTGLAVAAGHRPFLAGLAWFDRVGANGRSREEDSGPGDPGAGDLALVVEQYLVPDLEPATERAWLAAIARRVAEHPWLVTFNGRGFDWPMLATRWQWNRLPAPAPAAHFDLLYPARRLWAGPGQRVNLRALEFRFLGVLRHDDVPGAEIPGRYARFLQSRSPAGPGAGNPWPGTPDPGAEPPYPRDAGKGAEPPLTGAAGAGDAAGVLLPVLRHNLLDLLSLVGITAHIGGWLAAGPAGTCRWDEALAAGHEWERVDAATAVAWYERALALARGRTAVAAVARRLVPLYRRQRRWGDAVAVQAALCDPQHPLAPVEPWLDLAELWLRCRDRRRAAACLAQARRLWERRHRLPLAGVRRAGGAGPRPAPGGTSSAGGAPAAAPGAPPGSGAAASGTTPDPGNGGHRGRVPEEPLPASPSPLERRLARLQRLVAEPGGDAQARAL